MHNWTVSVHCTQDQQMSFKTPALLTRGTSPRFSAWFSKFSQPLAGECCLRTSLKMHEVSCVTRCRRRGRAPGLTFPITISLFIDKFADFSPAVGIDLHSEAPFPCFYNLDTPLNPSRRASVVQVHQPCEAGHPHGISIGSKSIWPLELISFSFLPQLSVREALKNMSVLLKVTSGRDKASDRSFECAALH